MIVVMGHSRRAQGRTIDLIADVGEGFGSWTMGYRATTDMLADEIPGYGGVAGAPLDGARAPLPAGT